MAMTDVTAGAAAGVVVAAAGAAATDEVAWLVCGARCLVAAEALLAVNGTTAMARATAATRRRRGGFIPLVSGPGPNRMIPQNVGAIKLVSAATDRYPTGSERRWTGDRAAVKPLLPLLTPRP